MAELVVEVFAIMESRFGRFGPVMTRILLMSLVLGALLWAVRMIREELIVPLLGIVEDGDALESLATSTALGIAVALSFMLWGWWYVRRQAMRRLEEIRAKREEVEQYILSHRSTNVFVFPSEDASKAGWPEIERAVDEVERAQDAEESENA